MINLLQQYGVDIKKNASNRNLEFSLNKQVFEKIITSNCHYCNSEPSNHAIRKHYFDYYYNGIDRINNEIGYIETNIVSCCKLCNFFKGRLTQTQFMEHVLKISDFQKRVIKT